MTTAVSTLSSLTRRESPLIDLEAEADLSRCGALKDFWYVACLSTELTPNRPLARTLFGVRLVLFRDAQGQPVALRDRCLHRQACLSGGTVNAGHIRCPYHGWSYDSRGDCADIPSSGPDQRGQVLAEQEHVKAGLRLSPREVGRIASYHTHEQDGLVSLFMGKEVRTARSAPLAIPHARDPEWCTYFMVTRFSNGVTNLVENFMDVPHTVFVHRGWFRRQARKRVEAVVRREHGTVHITYEERRDRLTGLGRLLNPLNQDMSHTDQYLIPNITRVDYTFGTRGGLVITSQVTPVGPTDSLVYTAISYRFPFDLPRHLLARALRPLVAWYTRQVIQQDVAIMENQRIGLTSGSGGGRFVSTEADLPHADIEAYRAWLRDGGTGDGPADDVRRIAFWM
jgi:phenylpropionate dioxygenase-like ring-hydroxylating dioxygenase large terminal subunit